MSPPLFTLFLEADCMGGTIKKKKGTSSNCFCWLLEEGGGASACESGEERGEREREAEGEKKRGRGGRKMAGFPPAPQLLRSPKILSLFSPSLS